MTKVLHLSIVYNNERLENSQVSVTGGWLIALYACI